MAPLTYHNFEEEIHALILERGRAYFSAGAVHHLTKEPQGWAATVSGQTDYRVVLNGKDELREWFCSCPHAHGPVCKHVAAVLYALADAQLSEEQSLDMALGVLTQTDDSRLRDFVAERIRGSSEWRSEFLAFTGQVSNEEE